MEERAHGAGVASAALLLEEASAIVVLTGAGVSAESGVPTFREAQTGLWARYDAEELASPRAFQRDPGLVWRWYMWRLALIEGAQPNPGHRAVAALQQRRPGVSLVTQNVDQLHERAGSRDVLHLHGRLDRFRCSVCGHSHTLREQEREADEPPPCARCGGLVRPGVVWFGESLPARAIERATALAEECDLMLVVGTSGVVYPAAQLPFIAKEAGARVIDINPEAGPFDAIADLCLRGPSGAILPEMLGV